MTPEQIRTHAPRILTQAQREHYFEHGYVGCESLVPQATLAEIQAVTADFLEQSRAVSESGSRFDVGPGHCARTPVLRRLKSPSELAGALLELMGDGAKLEACSRGAAESASSG